MKNTSRGGGHNIPLDSYSQLLLHEVEDSLRLAKPNRAAILFREISSRLFDLDFGAGPRGDAVVACAESRARDSECTGRVHQHFKSPARWPQQQGIKIARFSFIASASMERKRAAGGARALH